MLSLNHGHALTDSEARTGTVTSRLGPIPDARDLASVPFRIPEGIQDARLQLFPRHKVLGQRTQQQKLLAAHPEGSYAVAQPKEYVADKVPFTRLGVASSLLSDANHLDVIETPDTVY